MNDLIPDFYFNRITDISPVFLKNHNIRAVGIDLDNTVVFDSTLTPMQGAKEWINKIKDANINIVIITNTFTLRAALLGRKFGIPYYSMSKKPNPDNILKAVEKYNVAKNEFMMIGDLLLNDVAAANRAGVISVKVEPFMKEILLAGKYRRKRAKEEMIKQTYQNEFPEMKGIYDEY